MADGGVAEGTGKPAYFVKRPPQQRARNGDNPGVVEMKSCRHTGSEGRSGGTVGLNWFRGWVTSGLRPGPQTAPRWNERPGLAD